MQEGSVVTGLVTGTASFGAFLDINGVKGLVHISQIREGKVKNVAKELSVGQEVTARVLMVEPDTGRVRLSMKALEKTKPRVDRVKDNDSVPEHMQVGLCLGGAHRAEQWCRQGRFVIVRWCTCSIAGRPPCWVRQSGAGLFHARRGCTGL
jgi:predicted RNA-binding protein with RPS1 domain